jgi:hypothetical protein
MGFLRPLLWNQSRLCPGLRAQPRLTCHWPAVRALPQTLVWYSYSFMPSLLTPGEATGQDTESLNFSWPLC